MKFSIVTLYDELRKEFGELTSRVAKDYALAHGYRFTCHRDVLDKERYAQWSKILAVKHEMEKGDDWILWLDADALIVQPRIRLEEILNSCTEANKEIYFSSDGNGLCTGVFLIKNSPWSKSFLEAVYLLGQLPNCGHILEQATVMLLVGTFPAVKERIGLINDSLIQNPDSVFSNEAFIMHYWAATRPFSYLQEKIMNICYHGWRREFF